LILKNYSHHYSIDRQYLPIKIIGEPIHPNICPDIAVIIIPERETSTIKTYKSFWNIDLWREKLMRTPVDFTKGVWTIFGCPDEMTKSKGKNEHFARSEGFCGLAGFTGVSKYYSIDSYDYYDLSASYDENSHSPSSFGGVSGGGLWHILLLKKDNGISFERPVYSGVAFYQTEIINNKRQLICHGYRSIYENVYEAMKL
jgi:hypothetical protein